jgi:hypothetical protein
VVCVGNRYGWDDQGIHCDTIVFSYCTLAGLIDSLGDTRLDKMLTKVFSGARKENAGWNGEWPGEQV